MANKLAKIRSGNPKVELQEDILVPHSTTAASITGGSATETITVATGTGKYFRAGTLVRNTSAAENYLVTASPAADAVAMATVGGGNMTAGTAVTLLIIGSAHAEGSASAQALSTQSTFPYNYLQNFKKAVHLSGTQLATVNYGGDDWTNQRVKATKEFKLDIERNFIYGIRYLDTTATANIWYTSGLLDTAGMGISDVSQYPGDAFATEAYFFNTYCKNLFAKGSGEKTLYCGSDAIAAINDYSKVKQQTKVGEKEYGVDINAILTPFGRLNIQWHPQLEGEFANWAIGLDRNEYLKYAYLSNGEVNRDMQYQDNIGTPGTDERKSQYLAQIGLWLAGGGQGVHRTLYPGA